MKHKAISVRAFIGAKDYELSRSFYKDLGFEEIIIPSNMCYFKINETLGFYLQNAYVKDWIDNTMLFLEVEHVDEHWNKLQKLGLPDKYKGVRLTSIKTLDWGREYFLHDPSGVLWHFGEFKK